MVQFRNYVVFRSSLPDDASWDERGFPDVPGGKAITDKLHGGIGKYGFDATDVSQRSFYGWEFELASKNCNFRCVLQSYEDNQWLFICQPVYRFFKIFGKSKAQPSVIRVLNALNSTLASDHSFSDVWWYSKEEFENGCIGGSANPTIAE